MANLRITGIKGSESRKSITDSTGIGLYTGQKGVDAIINYGLSGDKLRAFLRRYPSARTVPMINKTVGHSKYSIIKRAENAGILVPESVITLPRLSKTSNWIEKRINSSQGWGIKRASGRGRIPGKYYQKFLKDRRYELRIHAFLWLPKDRWKIDKRVGPADQIAWNFKQGGHFISVRNPGTYKIFADAKNVSEKVLKLCSMSFGAVDFIVDNNSNLYFIEVNSAAGFSGLNAPTYRDAFLALKGMRPKEVLKYC